MFIFDSNDLKNTSKSVVTWLHPLRVLLGLFAAFSFTNDAIEGCLNNTGYHTIQLYVKLINSDLTTKFFRCYSTTTLLESGITTREETANITGHSNVENLAYYEKKSKG